MKRITDFKRTSLGTCGPVYYDIAGLDFNESTIVFLSVCGTDKNIKDTVMNFNKSNNLYISSVGSYFTTRNGKYDNSLQKSSFSNYCHTVVNRRGTNEEILNSENVATGDSATVEYIYVYPDEDFSDKLFETIQESCPVPIMKEWIEYIRTSLVSRDKLNELRVIHIYDQAPFRLYKLSITRETLQNIITAGIQDKTISINGISENSDLIDEIDGLDSYLNIFGDTLANKIQESFVPKFNPETDKYDTFLDYYDDSCFHNGVNLYPAQRNCMQSAVKNLEENDTTLVIAEMGSGKKFAVLDRNI